MACWNICKAQSSECHINNLVKDWCETDDLLQADSKEKHVKDLAVVLGTETATIILDDTISVWPEHQHNLMQVLTMVL